MVRGLTQARGLTRGERRDIQNPAGLPRQHARQGESRQIGDRGNVQGNESLNRIDVLLGGPTMEQVPALLMSVPTTAPSSTSSCPQGARCVGHCASPNPVPLDAPVTSAIAVLTVAHLSEVGSCYRGTRCRPLPSHDLQIEHENRVKDRHEKQRDDRCESKASDLGVAQRFPQRSAMER